MAQFAKGLKTNEQKLKYQPVFEISIATGNRHFRIERFFLVLLNEVLQISISVDIEVKAIVTSFYKP